MPLPRQNCRSTGVPTEVVESEEQDGPAEPTVDLVPYLIVSEGVGKPDAAPAIAGQYVSK